MIQEFIELENGNLPYLDGGSGPVLLFLHGAIGTPHAYIKLLDLFTDKYRVIAPIHPGHGNAFDIKDNWTTDDFIRVYHELLVKLDLIPEIIIGHSFGGALGLLLGVHYPQAKIIVIDPAGLPLNLTVNQYLKFMTDEAKELLRERPDLERFHETFSATGTLLYTVVMHPEEIPWFANNIPSMDISNTLTRLTNEVHLIWGAEDHIVSVENGYKMKALIPQATLTILPKFGHIYPVTCIEETYATIMQKI